MSTTPGFSLALLERTFVFCPLFLRKNGIVRYNAFLGNIKDGSGEKWDIVCVLCGAHGEGSVSTSAWCRDERRGNGLRKYNDDLP